MTPVPGTHTSGIHVIRVGNVGGKASGWCAHARREELGGAVGGGCEARYGRVEARRRRRPSERRRDASARLTPFDPRTRSPVVHSIVSYFSPRCVYVHLEIRSREGGVLARRKEGRRGDSRGGRRRGDLSTGVTGTSYFAYCVRCDVWRVYGVRE